MNRLLNNQTTTSGTFHSACYVMDKPNDETSTLQEVENVYLSKTVDIPKRIEMTSTVFIQIRDTIGKEPAETGGILGMSSLGDKIDHFFFDSLPDGFTNASYTPNCTAINCLLKKWTPKNIVYMGAIHSHPVGFISPSSEDWVYAQRLLDNNLNYDKAKSFFYMPIVQSSADNKLFKLFSYIAYYKNEEFTVEPIVLYIDGKKYKRNKRKWLSPSLRYADNNRYLPKQSNYHCQAKC